MIDPAGRGHRVRDVIERVVSEGSVVAASDGSAHEIFPVAIPAAEGEALRDWVIRERAERTVEIGLGYGVSALFICEGLLAGAGRDPLHVALDPKQSTRFGGCGLQLLEEAGVREMVEFHQVPSELRSPRFVEERRRFDLAFVDGNHRFDGVFVDLFYLGRLVQPGGVIFLDDYQLPGLARAVSFWVSNLGWSVEEASEEDEFHSWAVLRTSREPDARSFDAFTEF